MLAYYLCCRTLRLIVERKKRYRLPCTHVFILILINFVVRVAKTTTLGVDEPTPENHVILLRKLEAKTQVVDMSFMLPQRN